jgi:hypothetical protein
MGWPHAAQPTVLRGGSGEAGSWCPQAGQVRSS